MCMSTSKLSLALFSLSSSTNSHPGWVRVSGQQPKAQSPVKRSGCRTWAGSPEWRGSVGSSNNKMGGEGDMIDSEDAVMEVTGGKHLAVKGLRLRVKDVAVLA